MPKSENLTSNTREPSMSAAITHPLSFAQSKQVITHVNTYIHKARLLYARKIPVCEVKFDLKGRAAGMYRVKQANLRTSREIRFNPHIFTRYFDDNIATTVPHEVAHYVCDIIYGLKNIKPHGKEWRQIMSDFGADDSVTASYDLTDIPYKKQRSVTYQCLCGDKQLSQTRHNRVIKRQYQYYCKTCKQTLKQKAIVTA